MTEQTNLLPLASASNLQQIKAFQCVFNTGSVSQAAELLGRTQPAITTAIKKIEAELGLKLFERRSGRLFPTPEARYLSHKVERALEALQGVSESARELRELKIGSVKIASHAGMAFAFGPQVIADYLKRHPGVTLAMDVRESNKVNEFIASGHHEIGLSDSPVDDPLIDCNVFRLRCVAVLPESHPLASKAVLTPEDLAGEPFIAIGQDMNVSSYIHVAFKDAKAQLNTVVQTRFFSTACNMVANGFGVSIVSPTAAFEELDNGLVACRFEPAVHFEVALLRPSTRDISCAAYDLYELFQSRLAEISEN